MKESYIEGLAIHDDLESCGGVQEDTIEALTEALTGRVVSREIRQFEVPRLLSYAKGYTSIRANAREWKTSRGRRPLAGKETP